MTVKDIVLIALFAAVIAALGSIPPLVLPFIAVPITAQSLGVMLAGALLGAKRGFCAVLVIWILVAVGLPVLSGGRGGIGVFAGPTAGYFIGWAFGAALIGYLYQTFRQKLSPVNEVIFLTLGGVVVIYFFGIMWQAIVSEASIWHILFANLIFLPGDAVKIAICYYITRLVHKALPGMFSTADETAH